MSTSTYAATAAAAAGEESAHPLEARTVPVEHARACRRLYATGTRLYVTGAALAVAGLIVGLNYAYLTVAPASLRYALLALSAVLLTLSGVAIIMGWDRRNAITDLHQQMMGRVAVLERQETSAAATVSDKDGYLAGWADGLAGRMLERSNVRPLNGHQDK